MIRRSCSLLGKAPFQFWQESFDCDSPRREPICDIGLWSNFKPRPAQRCFAAITHIMRTLLVIFGITIWLAAAAYAQPEAPPSPVDLAQKVFDTGDYPECLKRI